MNTFIFSIDSEQCRKGKFTRIQLVQHFCKNDEQLFHTQESRFLRILLLLPMCGYTIMMNE